MWLCWLNEIMHRMTRYKIWNLWSFYWVPWLHSLFKVSFPLFLQSWYKPVIWHTFQTESGKQNEKNHLTQKWPAILSSLSCSCLQVESQISVVSTWLTFSKVLFTTFNPIYLFFFFCETLTVRPPALLSIITDWSTFGTHGEVVYGSSFFLSPPHFFSPTPPCFSLPFYYIKKLLKTNSSELLFLL